MRNVSWNMLLDEELYQIHDPIYHQTSAGLLFLGRRISPLCSSGEYLQGCRTSLVQGTRPYGPIVYLRRRDPAPPAR